MWTVVLAGFLMLGSCSNADQEQIQRLAMPVPATDRAPEILELWKWSWLAAIIIGVLVWGLIGWAAFRYRRRHHDEVPVQTRYNLPIEILYTVAPIFVVLVLFYHTVVTQNEVLADEPEVDHEIVVVGAKWSWTFNYMNEPSLGSDDATNDVFLAGTPQNFPTLVLPVGETIDVELRSPDVIHSFWVPSFLFKLDVVPGRTNSFSFTPTREGTFAGKCAELCGTYHSRMLFNVDVVSGEEYQAYLQSLAARGNVGTALGNAETLTPTGLEDQVQDDDLTGQGDAE